MSKIDSYITTSELATAWPNSTEFSSGSIQTALSSSYSMVNSHLGHLTIPVISQGGAIPEILKFGQLRFAMYSLELGNFGWTEENQQLFDKNVEFLSKITQNQIGITEVGTWSSEIGWNIIENNISAGSIWVQGTPPSVENTFTFTVSSSGTVYADSVTLTVVRDNSSSTLATVVGNANNDWILVDNTNMAIFLTGQFTQNETFKIKGVPDTRNASGVGPVIQSSEILY